MNLAHPPRSVREGRWQPRRPPTTRRADSPVQKPIPKRLDHNRLKVRNLLIAWGRKKPPQPDY